MAGYHGWSKSNNAIVAEQENRYPASVLARKLKVTTAAVKQVLCPSEWHHTSSYYNETDYYDGDLLIKIVKRKDLSDYTDTEIAEGKEQLALMQALKREKSELSEKRYRADIQYLVWGGTKRHPKAKEVKYKNVEVIEKGCFYTFITPNGNVRKKIGSNGTYVTLLKGD